MAEIAKPCGVSRTAVSHVLNRATLANRLQPETRKRIEEKARELGCRPNEAARAIKTGRTRSIAVIVPPLHFESSILVVHGMALAANEAGYQVKYLPAEHGHEDADALVGTCVERMVAGIVTLNCDYLRHHNAQPNPFIWTAKAADILAKVTRAKAALVMSQN